MFPIAFGRWSKALCELCTGFITCFYRSRPNILDMLYIPIDKIKKAGTEMFHKHLPFGAHQKQVQRRFLIKLLFDAALLCDVSCFMLLQLWRLFA